MAVLTPDGLLTSGEALPFQRWAGSGDAGGLSGGCVEDGQDMAGLTRGSGD